MLVVPQKVDMKWIGASRTYFEDKGYAFTGYNTSFQVDPIDLQPGSDKRVRVICSICKLENKKSVQYKHYNKLVKKNQDYVCSECKGQRIS